MVDALESQAPLPIAGFGEGRQCHATSLGAPQLPNLTSFPDLQGTEPRQLPRGGDTSSLRVKRSLFKSTQPHCRALQLTPTKFHFGNAGIRVISIALIHPSPCVLAWQYCLSLHDTPHSFFSCRPQPLERQGQQCPLNGWLLNIFLCPHRSVSDFMHYLACSLQPPTHHSRTACFLLAFSAGLCPGINGPWMGR